MEGPPKQLGFPDAMVAAVNAVDGGWQARAVIAVIKVAGSRERFTSDDVWKELADELPPSGDPRALGAIMRKSAAEGYCRRLPKTYEESTRGSRHQGPVQVWQSQIYVPR